MGFGVKSGGLAKGRTLKLGLQAKSEYRECDVNFDGKGKDSRKGTRFVLQHSSLDDSEEEKKCTQHDVVPLTSPNTLAVSPR